MSGGEVVNGCIERTTRSRLPESRLVPLHLVIVVVTTTPYCLPASESLSKTHLDGIISDPSLLLVCPRQITTSSSVAHSRPDVARRDFSPMGSLVSLSPAGGD